MKKDSVRFVKECYDKLANNYKLLYEDWNESIENHAFVLASIFKSLSISPNASILDCACGIGTQLIGLSKQGFTMYGCDISDKSLQVLSKELTKRKLNAKLKNGDFRYLTNLYKNKFNVIIACDNALPHLINKVDFQSTCQQIFSLLQSGGACVLSFRNYDEILKTKPSFAPKFYFFNNEYGKRIYFQNWIWQGNSKIYEMEFFLLIEKKGRWDITNAKGVYRAYSKKEIVKILRESGFTSITWKTPEETGYFQPMVVCLKS